MGRKRNICDVAIVADGNGSIGLGHLMRSSAIAEALKILGYRVCFLVSDAHSEETVRQLGHDCVCLNEDYRSLAARPEGLKACLEKLQARFVFFDSYFADNALFEAVSPVCPVGCFGYGKKYFRGMRLIVPYGVSSDWAWYKENFDPQITQVLAGARYVPLKSTFWNMPARDGAREVRRILLTCGGTDPLGITETLIEKIRQRFPEPELDVVVGRFFDVKRLKAQAGNWDKVCFHEGLTDLSGLIVQADLAVSAAGMTLYELMAGSVPVIAYAMADNQLSNYKLEPALIWCGDIRKEPGLDAQAVERILSRLEQLLDEKEKRLRLQESGYAMCDGKGAVRIAEAISRLIGEHHS